MPHFYILFSQKDHRTYVGSTTDLDRRIHEHQLGKVRSTCHRKPLRLIYAEELSTIEQARSREQYFKTAAGRRLLKKTVFGQKNN